MQWYTAFDTKTVNYFYIDISLIKHLSNGFEQDSS